MTLASSRLRCGRILLFMLVAGYLSLAGCWTPRGTSCAPVVPETVRPWTSQPVCSVACPGEFTLPPDTSLDDGLCEDEAVATALTNNAAFRATLTQLGMARGDVIQAGLLTNPQLLYLFPVGAKQWEATLYIPIEAFVLRPHRLEIAERDYQRVANTLVQNGLDFVRNVRVAYADLALATAQAELANDTVEMRQKVADLTQRRLERGDISELEASSARIDALNARALAGAAALNVSLAGARLSNLMGLPRTEQALRANSLEPVPPIALDSESLVEQALAARPDLQAAEWAVASTAKRARLARWQFWRVDGVIDANERGARGGSEIGPGIRMDLPIFNRNEGGITRVNAELMQAQFNRDSIRDIIVQDVRVAVVQLEQAQEQLTILREQLVPSLRETQAIAERSYQTGGTSYLQFLQTTSDYIAARTRELDQMAAVRRAVAELERSVARKIISPAEPCTHETPILKLPPVDEPLPLVDPEVN
jgi:cobalt-zinc-cadmium efflux system outer membrane protein